jgi:hypothetical protein
MCHQNHQVILCLISQAKLTYPEEWIKWRVNTHLFLFKLGGSITQAGYLFLYFCQELLYPNCQGLKLEFLDDQGNGTLSLPPLEVEDALAWLA